MTTEALHLTIRSGGQTGVDRAALEVARELGLDYGGWCPCGGWAEDHPEPPGVLSEYPDLVETPSSDPAQRTAWNVRDSHGTLILLPDEEHDASPGTHFARVCAELVFQKPVHVALLGHGGPNDTVRAWLADLGRQAGGPGVCVNVAGPRESEVPGIEGWASEYLRSLLMDGADAWRREE